MSTVAESKPVKKVPSTPTRSKKAAKAADAEKSAANLVTPVASKARQESLTVTPKVSHRKARLSLIGDEVDDVEDENLNLSNVSASNIVSPSKVIRSTLEVDPKVEEAYKIIRKVTGVLGGNGSTGAIYGELTLRALQRVYNIMTEKCNLTKSSRMIDVGAGLGKPNFHAAQDPAVRLSLGMELEDIRWNVSKSKFTILTFILFQTDQHDLLSHILSILAALDAQPRALFEARGGRHRHRR